MTAQSFIVGLSTSSPTAVEVKVELEEQKDFFLKADTSYTLTVSPSQPKYAFYKFTKTTSDTVVVEVESGDDVCLTMSIQDAKVLSQFHHLLRILRGKYSVPLISCVIKMNQFRLLLKSNNYIHILTLIV
nr:unnamed protein product [Callosobruchus analis]